MFPFYRKNIIYVLGLLVLAIIIGYSYGYLASLDSEYNSEKMDIRNLDDQPKSSSIPDKSDIDGIVGVENSSKEHTSVNTVLEFETFYKKCHHTVTEKRKIKPSEIGINRRELARLYSSWEIELFSTDRVILKREIDNYCPNHYVIKNVNGYVAICRPNKDQEGLYVVEQTRLKSSKLEKQLQEALEKGIVLDSVEEVERLIENWDS